MGVGSCGIVHLSLLRHLVDDQLLKIVELSVPLVQGLVSWGSFPALVQLQYSRHLVQDGFNTQKENRFSYLVNSARNGIVKDTTDKETFHIVGVNVEFSRDELDVDASVGLDQFDQHL